MVVSGNSSRATGVSYALRPRKRLTAASVSPSVAGDNRTIQSSVWTRSLPSQTDLPLGRYGAWNVISISSTHAGAACAASYQRSVTPGFNTIPAALITPGADPP